MTARRTPRARHQAVLRRQGQRDHGQDRRRHEHQSQRRRHTEGLAERQIAAADADAEQLPQGALLALPCKRAERHQHDEQRQQHLQHLGAGHLAEALDRGAILCRAELELVLLVRLQPGRDTDVGIDAGVDHRQLALGLERVDAVVRRRMGILPVLVQPLGARFGTGGRVLTAQLGVVLPAGAERQQRDEQHHRREQPEAAVAQHLRHFLARNPANHACAPGRRARGRRG
jgi:hypothetical protein